MILPGRLAVSRKIITNILCVSQQAQPCGVDLTLKRVLTWTSPGTIDFDNDRRKIASTNSIDFVNDDPGAFIDLSAGSYLVEFNETVDMPLDIMGQIYVRSSLFRSGATIHAGVMDSGYKGVVGAVLQVANPHGIRLIKHAKLGQMVFHEMSEPVEGYDGVYQGSAKV